IAERRPVVMLFEDLQWADAGLLDFIESVLEWSRTLPILIVTLARPELAEKRPDWGSTQRSFTSLRLEPLSEASMTEMVERVAHGRQLDPSRPAGDTSEGPGSEGGPRIRAGSAVTRERAVRLPAEPDQRGRIRDPRQGGPTASASGRRASARGARRRGARGRG